MQFWLIPGTGDNMKARLAVSLLLLLAACSGSNGSVDGGSPPEDSSLDSTPIFDAQPAMDSIPPDAGPARICGPAPVAYTGTLCGPAPTPCRLKSTEEVPTSQATRFSAMALGADDGLHFTGTQANHTGYYNHRPKGGQWVGMKVAFDPVLRGLTITPHGDVLSVGTGSTATIPSLYKLAAGGWKQVQKLPSPWGFKKLGRLGSLHSDSAGCLHTFREENNLTIYMQRGVSGIWREVAGPSPYETSGSRLTLSPAGVPLLAYQHKYNLYLWQLGDKKAWMANPNKSSTSSSEEVAAAVTKGGSAEVLHMLHVNYHLDANGKRVRKLVYSFGEDKTWTHMDVGIDGEANCGVCTIGAKCAVDLYTYSPDTRSYGLKWPLRIIASGSGDVRLLFVRVRSYGLVEGKYNKFSLDCAWTGGLMNTRELRVAWVSKGKIRSSGVNGLMIPFASEYMFKQFLLDRSGDIHIAESTITGTHKLNIRHLVIGK